MWRGVAPGRSVHSPVHISLVVRDNLFVGDAGRGIYTGCVMVRCLNGTEGIGVNGDFINSTEIEVAIQIAGATNGQRTPGVGQERSARRHWDSVCRHRT